MVRPYLGTIENVLVPRDAQQSYLKADGGVHTVASMGGMRTCRFPSLARRSKTGKHFTAIVGSVLVIRKQFLHEAGQFISRVFAIPALLQFLSYVA